MDLEICPSNRGFSDTEQVILHRYLGLEPPYTLSSRPHAPRPVLCAEPSLATLPGVRGVVPPSAGLLACRSPVAGHGVQRPSEAQAEGTAAPS